MSLSRAITVKPSHVVQQYQNRPLVIKNILRIIIKKVQIKKEKKNYFSIKLKLNEITLRDFYPPN